MYRKKEGGWVKHLDFIILDLVCVELAYTFAYLCRHGFVQHFFWNTVYSQMALLLGTADICVAFFTDSYHGILRRGYLVEFQSILKHNTYILVILLVYLFFAKRSATYSRTVLFLMWAFACAIMMLVRSLWKYFLRESKKSSQKLLLITESVFAETLVREFRGEAYMEYELVGVAVTDRDMRGQEIAGATVVACREDFSVYIKEHVVDQVFLSVPEGEPELEKWVNQLIDMGLAVHVSLARFTAQMAHASVEEFGGHVVLSAGMKSVTYGEMLLKRVMDICGALVGLALTGVIFVIFAPIIYIQSPGRIFFVQERVGKNGRIFKIYKFRSMYPDAEKRKEELIGRNKMKGQMFKIDDDPRIIPVGRFMRRMSLDEFPQFLNVLKGEMSLVGTRPPTVEEYRQYGLEHKKRLAAKPGITGMWQTSGRSKIVDFDEVVALDARYISEWSLWLDVKLLCKTVILVAEGNGAV